MAISIDNGNTFITADELPEREADIIQRWDSIVSMMDDTTREAVHAELAPCTEIEFLARYLEIAESDLII